MPGLGTVLIVADEVADALLTGIALQEENCCNPLEVVTDAEDAIRYLSGAGKFANRDDHPFPVLLLLDLRLPRSTGLEVLRWLSYYPDIRTGLTVVVWSPQPSPDATQAVLELGIEEILRKPRHLHELRERFRAFKHQWPDILG